VRKFFLLLATIASFSAACDESNPSSPSSVAAITVSGTTPAVGAVAQFTATAAMRDGSSRSVTADAMWTSSNTTVATVDRGMVRSLAVGEADISAIYENVTGRLRITVVSSPTGNCVTSVSPSTADYSAELKRGTVSVTAPAGCQWTAVSPFSFISLDRFGASGNGNGSFIYRVFGNLTSAPRSGSLQVGQQTVNVTQRAPLGGNFVSFVSDAGDYIGQGWTLLHEAPTSTFTPPTPDPSRNRLTLRIVGSDGLSTLNWGLDLAAPQGQQLVAGTYLNATRYPFQAPTVPGLNFSGDGRGCNMLSGQFTITEIVFGGDGSIQRLRATFEQHCEGAGPALRGTVSYAR